jgi:hypothetical protein
MLGLLVFAIRQAGIFRNGSSTARSTRRGRGKSRFGSALAFRSGETCRTRTGSTGWGVVPPFGWGNRLVETLRPTGRYPEAAHGCRKCDTMTAAGLPGAGGVAAGTCRVASAMRRSAVIGGRGPDGNWLARNGSLRECVGQAQSTCPANDVLRRVAWPEPAASRVQRPHGTNAPGESIGRAPRGDGHEGPRNQTEKGPNPTVRPALALLNPSGFPCLCRSATGR